MFAKKKKEEFKKKVKLPNKYKNVKKTLDTGMTVNDVIMLSNNQVVKKNSEIFKRITAKKLRYILNTDPLSESVITNNRENENYNNNIDLKNNFVYSKNHLIVDLRSVEKYEKFHIKNGKLKSFVNSYNEI